MRPAIHWFAVPLLALVLPGMSPIESAPDGPALPGIAEPAADPIPLPYQCLLERNHGACVSCCCRAVLDCGPGTGIVRYGCAFFGKNNTPPLPGPGEYPAP